MELRHPMPPPKEESGRRSKAFLHHLPVQQVRLLRPQDISNNFLRTPTVRTHLTRVYASLSTALLCAAVGSYIQIAYNVSQGLFSCAFIISLLYFLFMSRTPENMANRANVLMALAFFKGGSIGPLINAVATIEPSIITTAFLGTCAIFACFSVSSLKAQRRSYLFLGGILSSALLLLAVVGLANFFFGFGAMLSLQLYGGFLVFCGYVLYDTQLIVEKAFLGSYDYPQHALELFIDFVAIFVRLLIILAKNNDEDRDRRRRRRD